MSVQASTWVWAHSKSEGTARLVMLAVADAANKHGDYSCQSVATIAEMVHASERTVQRSLRELEASGELLSRGTDRRYRTTIYALAHMVAEGDTGVTPEGDSQGTLEGLRVTPGVVEGDTAMSPNPNIPVRHTPKNKRAAQPPAPGDAVAKALYDQTQGALSYMGMRVIGTWAIQVKGASSEQVVQAGLALYAAGKPVTKVTMGQALDGAINLPGGKGRVAEAYTDYWAQPGATFTTTATRG